MSDYIIFCRNYNTMGNLVFKYRYTTLNLRLQGKLVSPIPKSHFRVNVFTVCIAYVGLCAFYDALVLLVLKSFYRIKSNLFLFF